MSLGLYVPGIIPNAFRHFILPMSSLKSIEQIHFIEASHLKSPLKTLVHCWWECKLVQALWKTVWRFLKKLKIELPYHSATLLLGIYISEKKPKTLIQKDTCTPMFIAALFIMAKT